MLRTLAFALAVAAALTCSAQTSKQIDLPTTKAISDQAPGNPRRLNTYPSTMALSPDGKYVAILNDGYGTEEGKNPQSIAILNVATNELQDFPDDRLIEGAPQSYFVGLAWSLDGKQLYASVGSMTKPTGGAANAVGSGIAVYKFADGKLEPAKFLQLPLLSLKHSQKFTYGAENVKAGFANPYPAGLAVVEHDGHEMLLVAANVADAVLLVDATSGELKHRFDVARRKGVVPSKFPYRLLVSKDGRRAWCALWNDSALVELDLEKRKVRRRIALDSHRAEGQTGSHPNALAFSKDEKQLFVALATRDSVAVLDIKSGKVTGEVSTRLPGQNFEGTYPDALAISPDGKWLFVADATANAVLQFSVSELGKGTPAPKAFVPTEWYPMSVMVVGDDLLIGTGKGKGVGPNPPFGTKPGNPYIANLMHGSLARLPLSEIAAHVDAYKQEVLEENRLNGRSAEIAFAGGKNPIKHVIYIIKENRTYDQVFGDLGVGDGDPALTMFGQDITPNLHALARQFGVLDNFFDSGEVSGNGHVWSTAAITSEYTELDWPIAYRSSERGYDFEGKVGDIYPIEHDEDDINEPGTGYLWTNIAKHHLSYRHYGEFIDTEWCATTQQNSPASTGASGAHCPRAVIKQGEKLPETVGDPKGGPSPYPWDIPMIAKNTPTKRELRGHFDPNYADFRVEYPDQLRVDEFLNEFSTFVKAKESGHGEQLPAFVLLRIPNDHTAGTKPGMPTPQASVADNDLAVGRVIDALSHSPYWDDTAVFILEDDAQDGPDHVEAHRSTALVISKYSPRQDKPFVDHHFYTTVNVLRTMESLLGLPPMNHNDGQAALMAPLFSGDGSQPAFQANYRNRDNKLIYQANGPQAEGAKESEMMNFSKPDQADPQKLNAILWRVTKGDTPMPAPKHLPGLR